MYCKVWHTKVILLLDSVGGLSQWESVLKGLWLLKISPFRAAARGFSKRDDTAHPVKQLDETGLKTYMIYTESKDTLISMLTPLSDLFLAFFSGDWCKQKHLQGYLFLSLCVHQWHWRSSVAYHNNFIMLYLTYSGERMTPQGLF